MDSTSQLPLSHPLAANTKQWIKGISIVPTIEGSMAELKQSLKPWTGLTNENHVHPDFQYELNSWSLNPKSIQPFFYHHRLHE